MPPAAPSDVRSRASSQPQNGGGGGTTASSPLYTTASPLHTPSLWHRAQPRGDHSGSHTVFLHHFYGISSSQEHQKEGGAAGQTREGTSMCEKEKMAKKH